jgi:hypothetical protein
VVVDERVYAYAHLLQGLAKYGTDFEMVASLFTGRNRRHIKNKYKREEVDHPERVNDALFHRRSRPLASQPPNFDITGLLGPAPSELQEPFIPIARSTRSSCKVASKVEYV